jgi:hypothetical protein
LRNAGFGRKIMKIVVSLFVCALSIAPALANDLPKFQVDASWPKTLPNNWIMGQAAGVAVDAQDHIWVIQRPRSLTDDEKAATFNPPRTKCCVPAPPVMEFDQEGNLLKSWGGPGKATIGSRMSMASISMTKALSGSGATATTMAMC